jgi:hypothetical protein
MTLRSTLDTIQSLRVLLQDLEQCENTPQDEAALAELKRIVRHRITELELSVGIQATPVETVATRSMDEGERSAASPVKDHR